MTAFERTRADDRGTRQRAAHLSDRTATRRPKAKFSAIPIWRTRCRLIAKGGRDAYYKGEIAHTIDAYFKRIGGDLRYEDFAAHHGEWVDPLGVNYRGYDVYELPPNRQGAAVLQMLQILKGFDLKKMGAGSADTLTAMLEAKRLTYEDLAKWYADPAFANVPMKELLSDAYADARRKLIDLAKANPNVGPGDPQLSRATRPISPPPTRTA